MKKGAAPVKSQFLKRLPGADVPHRAPGVFAPRGFGAKLLCRSPLKRPQEIQQILPLLWVESVELRDHRIRLAAVARMRFDRVEQSPIRGRRAAVVQEKIPL